MIFVVWSLLLDMKLVLKYIDNEDVHNKFLSIISQAAMIQTSVNNYQPSLKINELLQYFISYCEFNE